MSAPRLERRLLRWLLPPLAAVLVGSAVLDGYLSRRPVTAAFDQQLLVIALAITDCLASSVILLQLPR